MENEKKKILKYAKIPWFKKEGEFLFNNLPFKWNYEFLNKIILENNVVKELIKTNLFRIYSNHGLNKEFPFEPINISYCIGFIEDIDINGIIVKLNPVYDELITTLIDNGKHIIALNSYYINRDTFGLKYSNTYLGYIEDSEIKFI